MNPTPSETSLDTRVARLIDANLDRAREGLRVVEDWCRFGLDREDLVVPIKDWRQQLGLLVQGGWVSPFRVGLWGTQWPLLVRRREQPPPR